MLSGEGRAHLVGQSSYQLYVPARIGSDSGFPWSTEEAGAETCVEVLPDTGVLVTRSEVELSDSEVAAIKEILQK